MRPLWSHYFAKSRLGRWIWTIVLLAFSWPAFANMYYTMSIGGPPVVHDGNVYFTQADETITVLDLSTGQVVRRLQSPRGFSRLVSTDAGLLAMGWDKVCLLDWASLTPRWSDAGTNSAAVVGSNVVLTSDNSGDVRVLELGTGREVWSISEGAYPAITVGDQVMIVQRGHVQSPRRALDSIRLMDVSSGKTLRDIDLPDCAQASRSYAFDGERMFVIDEPYDQSQPTLAYTLGPTGALKPTDPVTTACQYPVRLRIGNQPFDWEGRPIAQSLDPALRWPQTNRGVDVPGLIAQGCRLYDESWGRPENQFARLRFTCGQTTWRIVVPHLLAWHELRSMTLAEGVVLIATSRGNLECLDRKTGQSLWLYVSPWVRGALSTSGRGGPFFSTFVGEFGRERVSVGKRLASRVVLPRTDWAGMSDAQVLAIALPSASAVVEDPEPFDPFAEGRRLLFLMRLAPVMLGVIAGVVWLLAWRSVRYRWRIAAAGSAVLFLLPIPLLWYRGRVSEWASKALLIEMGVFAVVLVVAGVRSIRFRHDWRTTSVSCAAVLVSMWWVWPLVSWVWRG